MSREGAMERIAEYFENDGFFDDLARRVAIHTESQEPAQRPELTRYLSEEMTPYLEPLGFACEIFENPVPRGCARHRGDAGHPAQLGRLDLQRRVPRRAPDSDYLDPAQLRRLLPARARRTHHLAADARRHGDHRRAVLGPGRFGNRRAGQRRLE